MPTWTLVNPSAALAYSGCVHTRTNMLHSVPPLNAHTVQVLKFIAPNHKVALDIASYFRPPDPQEHTEEDVFPEVPMAGLHKKRRKKNISSKRTKQKSCKLNKKIPSNQPLINTALHNTAAASSSTTDDRHAETDIPPNILDELFDFDSQPTDNILPPVVKDPPTNELIPPFSEQIISETNKETDQFTPSCTKSHEGFSVNDVIKTSAGKYHSNSPASLSFGSPCELEYIPTDEACLLATPSTPVPMTSNKPEFAVLLSEATNQMSRSPSASSVECLSAADLESVFVSICVQFTTRLFPLLFSVN